MNMILRWVVFVCLFALGIGCDKKSSRETKQIVRVGMQGDPKTLDSRCARDLDSSGIIRMLFEGFMRVSIEGSIEPALLSRVEISEDQLEYVLHLKQTHWSNGDFVTAFDFVYAWKSILDPNFPTDIAQHLYPIKNARDAKIGSCSLDSVAIYAIDPFILRVELERPTPYFLELLAMTPFFPVPKDVVMKDSNWSNHEEILVSNGPFCLEKRQFTDQISMKKNSRYWQQEKVHLDCIDLCVVSPDTGLRMFEEKKLDWMGSPLSLIPPDAIASLKKEDLLHVSPFCATGFCRINTAKMIKEKKNPLSNIFLRRALSWALNRQAIVEHILQGGQATATRFVPVSMGLNKEGYFVDHDLDAARKELSSSEEMKEPIVIHYCQNERNTLIAQALQRQWQDDLGIEVQIEAVESKLFFQKVARKEYQIAIGSWTADFNDPLNFLEVFKFQDNGMNNTGWESPEYIDLLDRSAVCTNGEERKEILRQAERILMDEMPIIPIYHFVLNYVQNEGLEGALVSSQGYLDLRFANKRAL